MNRRAHSRIQLAAPAHAGAAGASRYLIVTPVAPPPGVVAGRAAPPPPALALG